MWKIDGSHVRAECPADSDAIMSSPFGTYTRWFSECIVAQLLYWVSFNASQNCSWRHRFIRFRFFCAVNSAVSMPLVFIDYATDAEWHVSANAWSHDYATAFGYCWKLIQNIRWLNCFIICIPIAPPLTSLRPFLGRPTLVGQVVSISVNFLFFSFLSIHGRAQQRKTSEAL